MEMYNADGSRGEMCGNGIRCVGKYVYEHGLVAQDPLRVDTDAGIKTLRLARRATAACERVTVDMGAPILDGPRIPVAAEGRVIDAPLEVGGATYRVTCVSMGNPHCVVFVARASTALDLERIGPRFEHHPFFPKRVNTEFVRVDSADALRMRVWERGSGETAACGTGACAALVAAVLTGRAERRATIHLNGGDLDIEWRAGDDHVFMTGAGRRGLLAARSRSEHGMRDCTFPRLDDRRSITPFRDGAIDCDALERIVECQIANGVDGARPVRQHRRVGDADPRGARRGRARSSSSGARARAGHRRHRLELDRRGHRLTRGARRRAPPPRC